MKPTYYACGTNPETGRIGLLAVVKVAGEPIRQHWTGEQYSTPRAAQAAVERHNRALFGVRSMTTKEIAS